MERLGSSPLARGTRCGGQAKASRLGLIPARAGNTKSAGTHPMPSWAHPRSRGEHVLRCERRATVRGSSPLARGTPAGAHMVTYRQGLIPARAGNTATPNHFQADRRAHPRSRGEHKERNRMLFKNTGSSPLARGTLSMPGLGEVPPGLIPARAGNTDTG